MPRAHAACACRVRMPRAHHPSRSPPCTVWGSLPSRARGRNAQAKCLPWCVPRERRWQNIKIPYMHAIGEKPRNPGGNWTQADVMRVFGDVDTWAPQYKRVLEYVCRDGIRECSGGYLVAGTWYPPEH